MEFEILAAIGGAFVAVEDDFAEYAGIYCQRSTMPWGRSSVQSGRTVPVARRDYGNGKGCCHYRHGIGGDGRLSQTECTRRDRMAAAGWQSGVPGAAFDSARAQVDVKREAQR